MIEILIWLVLVCLVLYVTIEFVFPLALLAVAIAGGAVAWVCEEGPGWLIDKLLAHFKK